MSDNLDAVMRRIQKLLAMAEDGRGDPNEAAAAASMAAKLMRKFQLDHADVVMASLKRDSEFDEVDVVATAKTNGTRVQAIPTWAQWIAVEVARLNDVRVVISSTQTAKGREACLRFMGFKADTQVAGWTLSYLVETVNRLCVAFRKNPTYLIHGRTEMNAYRHGVVTGINLNLRNAQQAKAAENAQVSSGRDLVVAKAQALDAKYGEFKTGKTSKVNTGRAFGDGVRDGRQVDVERRAVGTSQADTTLRPT